MSTGFYRTLRALELERFHAQYLAAGVGAALFLAWGAWFIFARVPVFRVSDNARIEAVEKVRSIESSVAGQVITQRLEVGRQVREGEVVVELDSSAQRFGLEEARAQLRESQSSAKLAAEEARRLGKLQRGGQIPEIELIRAAESATRAAAASDRLAATVKRLEYEIERRRIRAPFEGRVAERNPAVERGSVVREGELFGTIVPSGDFRVVAYFAPSDAIGRIVPGQTGKLRLEGFPWTQFGMLTGEVTRVSSEIRGGLVRVEQSIQPEPDSRIPIQHGLPGTLEVEVERVSPATLALRSLGAYLTDSSSARRPAGGPDASAAR